MIREPKDDRAASDELEWLAYCYVSGDLLGDERTTFENRLADDQGAREAVARAVELVQAVAAAESYVSPRPMPAAVARRTTWPRSLAWMSAGASAALVLVVAWIQWDAIAGWFAPPPADRQALAEVWSQTREAVREIVYTEPYEFSPPAKTELASEESLPSWIAAAVFNQAATDEADHDGPATHDES